MEQLLHVPQDQEIAFFYSLIRQDPKFLQAIDQKQFADTPLHIAAAEGRMLLALEIQRLMPSFGRKLNPDGFSPVDLALQRGHSETVSAMIKLNPELVRVQGREGITPLHCAAETDDVDMLAEFLLSCPDSIEELTVRGESAAHVAVKNGKLAAFRVLLGWLKRTDRRGVLSWRDWKGNTVLHLAASTNQPKVMELLIKEVWVNDKNSKGLTALDMVMELPTEVNGKALRILHRNQAKRGSLIREPKIANFADYLSSKISIKEKTFKLGAYLDMGLPGEIRNAVLVVAVLIATATYQAVLSPPGGFSNDQTAALNLNITSVPDSSSTSNITSNIGVDTLKTDQGEDNGKGEILLAPAVYRSSFMLVNSITFVASLGIILLQLPLRRHNVLLFVSLTYLMMSYFDALSAIVGNDAQAVIIMMLAFSAVFILIIGVKLWVFFRRNVRASRRLMGSNNFYNIHEMSRRHIIVRFSGSWEGSEYKDGEEELLFIPPGGFSHTDLTEEIHGIVQADRMNYDYVFFCV